MNYTKKLMRLAPPPANKFEADKTVDWQQVELKLGIGLPDDYKFIIDNYGLGYFSDFIWLYSPITEVKHLNLNMQHEETREMVIEYSDIYEGVLPYDYYPAKGGVLQLGADDSGCYIFWITDGEPNDWAVLIYDMKNDEFEKFNFGIAEYIYKWLTNEITVSIHHPSYQRDVQIENGESLSGTPIFVPYKPPIPKYISPKPIIDDLSPSEWNRENVKANSIIEGSCKPIKNIEWAKLAANIGLPHLPPSYIEYIETFGAGTWKSNFTIFCPSGSEWSKELLAFRKSFLAEIGEEYISRLPETHKDNPYYDPENIPPWEKYCSVDYEICKRLIPFAIFADGSYLGWDSQQLDDSGNMMIYTMDKYISGIKKLNYNLWEFLGYYWFGRQIDEVLGTTGESSLESSNIFKPSDTTNWNVSLVFDNSEIKGELKVPTDLNWNKLTQELKVPCPIPPSYIEYVEKFGAGAWETGLEIPTPTKHGWSKEMILLQKEYGDFIEEEGMPNLEEYVEGLREMLVQDWTKQLGNGKYERLSQLIPFARISDYYYVAWNPQETDSSNEMSIYAVEMGQLDRSWFVGKSLWEFLGRYWHKGHIDSTLMTPEGLTKTSNIFIAGE